MEKEFVPYELAVKLKELGFDDPCSGWYTPDKSLIKEYVTKMHLKAPLYQQAFRWFREKYYLDSWVYCSDESKGYFAIIVSCKRLVFYNENKNTYEEAEQACLIKLIEIVKNK